MRMNIKRIFISFVAILGVIAGVFFMKVQSISEDFSTVTGIKSTLSLLGGDNVVEIVDNDKSVFMLKKSDFVQSYIDDFATKGYVCSDIANNALSCKKDGKDVVLYLEMYTSQFVLFKPQNM